MRLTPQDLLRPDQVGELIKDIAKSCTRTDSHGRWQHYRKDQSLIDVEVAARDFSYAGSPARLVVVYDISEQRRREYDAHQASKMELVGQVAGGVAHHFNSILTAIGNHAGLLQP